MNTLSLYPWPCSRRDAHAPHDLPVGATCPGVPVHPATIAGGSYTTERPHDCGHHTRTPGCGGCDPGAVEYVRDDLHTAWRRVEQTANSAAETLTTDLRAQGILGPTDRVTFDSRPIRPERPTP